jgi:hypothetical protein
MVRHGCKGESRVTFIHGSHSIGVCAAPQDLMHDRAYTAPSLDMSADLKSAGV